MKIKNSYLFKIWVVVPILLMTVFTPLLVVKAKGGGKGKGGGGGAGKSSAASGDSYGGLDQMHNCETDQDCK